MDGNTIISGFVVSTVGMGFFMYGKKQHRAPQMAFGVLAMVFPYFVGGPLLIFGIFAALLALMWLAIRMGA